MRSERCWIAKFEKKCVSCTTNEKTIKDCDVNSSTFIIINDLNENKNENKNKIEFVKSVESVKSIIKSIIKQITNKKKIKNFINKNDADKQIFKEKKWIIYIFELNLIIKLKRKCEYKRQNIDMRVKICKQIVDVRNEFFENISFKKFDKK